MGTHMTACSSNGSKDDTSVAESNDETFAEEGEGDFADTASTDDAETTTTDQAATDTDMAEDTGADLSLDGGDQAVASNDLGGDTELPADSADVPSDAPSTDVASSDIAAPSDELSLDDPGALPEDTAPSTNAENITDNPAAPSDAGVFDTPPAETNFADNSLPPTDTSIAESTPEPEPEPAPPVEAAEPAPVRVAAPVVYAPYLKVKEAPFTAPGGETMNRVYVARPKDTNKSIAQKLYGDSKRSKDLVKWNPILKRGARTGDKVYYSSAANPSDSRMMNYYEEAGIAPQTYVTKDGDNIRTVSKSLLGFNNAWKEVWATNPNVESKGGVPAGLTLNYWPEGAMAPVQALAQNAPPPTDAGGLPTSLPDAAPQVPQNEMPPNGAAMGTTAPPPADPFNAPPPVADNGANPDPLAPPPPTDAMAQQAPPTDAPPAAADPMAPPPAQQAAVEPPPPAAPPVAAKPAKKPVVAAPMDEEGAMDPDTTLALGVGGILILAAAILFVVIRKNRAKRMDLGQTQV
jgi:hypothetical protein